MRRTKSPAYVAMIGSWRNNRFQKPPFVHKDDSVLQEASAQNHVCIHTSFNKYVRSEEFGQKKDKRLHLGLLPIPYAGDIARARIFILMLNPGLSTLGYFADEYDGHNGRNRLATLHQSGLDRRFPFSALNPDRAWVSKYWRSKFDDLIRLAMKKKQLDYCEALSFLAQRIAVLQLYPYRSPVFGLPKAITNQLGSSQLIRRFVKETLLPEARKGKTLLVVTRKPNKWGLHNRKNVVTYEGFESRAAHLSLRSRGGKAIAKQLGLT